MLTVGTLAKMKLAGEKITMLTCYDASFANLMEQVNIDVLLVGDSLGMTIQGNSSTLSVSLDEMIYHTRAVAKGAVNTMIMVDLPFGSYQMNKEQAFHSASQIMAAGAHMVKIEGGAWLAPTTEYLQMRGIPVCAHIGLTPQSVNTLGGYKVQGRNSVEANQLLEDALLHEKAGASMVLMECVPAKLAKEISQKLTMPTIGIGAGIDCDGQVLVLHDILGISTGKKIKFVHNFMANQSSIEAAIYSFIQAVKNKEFPTEEHSFD